MNTNIIENNKIIADFIGWEKYSHDRYSNIKNFKIYYCEDLKFHSDWNWLMEVVEKIESLNYTTDVQNIIGLGHYFRIYSAGADVITVRDYDTKIKSVYRGCLEFIKWYNLNSVS